jgi:hypothetical protein
MPNRDIYNSRVASLRDFSGGWNVTDDEHNMSRKFQPVSDNMIVGVDNSLDPRFGNKLLYNPKLGTEVAVSQSVTFTTLISTPFLTVNWVGHPFTSGMHIRIDSLSGTIPNITTQPTGYYGVIFLTANTFAIVLRVNATASATSAAMTMTGLRDNHMLGGNILDGTYFQGYSIIFSDIGEVIAINDTGTVSRVWDVSLSYATAGNPAGWRKPTGETALLHVSFDTWKQTLIVVNGRLNDKPIEIDMTRATPCQFLADPATSSNAFVYSAEFVQCFGKFTILYGSNNTATPTTNTATTVDISAKNTSAVFVGNPAPDDAVQIDLGRVTQTIEPRITGVSNIRNNAVVAFYDSAMLGDLTKYTGTAHDPDYSDQIPQHGSINHRVLANIGNDLFMCDYAGVPAFTQSLQSGSIVPERISELIAPALNKHLGRLNSTTLRYKPFAVFNPRDRQYMLFIPKFDSASVFNGSANPFTTVSDLASSQVVLVYAPSHTVDEGDYVTVSGAIDISGLPATNLNGTRLVTGKINDDYFLMAVGAVPATTNISGGGASVVFTPVNDENIGYIFTINSQLKIKRWTRYRNLMYTAGWVTRDGRVLFAQGNRIFQHGTKDAPLYADNILYYDYVSYAAGTQYAANARVYDSSDGKVYVCASLYVATQPTFVLERAFVPSQWSLYSGDVINFTVETPWSDNSDPFATKMTSHMMIQSAGTAAFTVSAYVDDIYRNESTLVRSPKMAINYTAGDAYGYGAFYTNYGGGIRTREKQLYGFPMRYKTMKLRITGSSREKLAISGIHFLYQKGSAWR